MPLTRILPPARLHSVRQRFPRLVRPRAADSHKGSYGTVAVIGGSEGMSGAGVLAAVAALKGGAGKVWLGFAQEQLPVPYLSAHPEIMLATAAALLQRQDASVYTVGCGLGQNEARQSLLRAAVAKAAESSAPLLLDADALNLLAVAPQTLPENTILTPHPLEAARLLGCGTAEVQHNRRRAALALAERYGCHIVLKGHASLVANPQGRIEENDSGNPGLATAGSGDVLSGLIAALLAQGLPPYEAAAAGVWLHGAAAELLAAQGYGPIGLTAGELPDAVRAVRNFVVAG